MIARPLEYVTPSLLSTLEKCFLQTAFRADPSRRTFQSPAVRLGRACHGLLERVAKGELSGESTDPWQDNLERIWQEEVSKQESALLQSARERHFGYAETWPEYDLQRARVFLRARKLLTYQSGRGSRSSHRPVEFGPERYYKAFAGRIRGRADLVFETKRGIELLEYKTGHIYEEIRPGERVVKEMYIKQLYLYAAMHQDVYGKWPVRGHIVPLAGKRVTLQIDPLAASETAKEALAHMARYNRSVAAGASPQHLARPSVEACRYCGYKADCPAFWSQPLEASDWKTAAHLEAVVLDLQTGTHGEATAALRVQRGTLAPGDYHVQINRAVELIPGTSVRIINLYVQDQQAQRLSATDYTYFAPCP